jgi:7,8-dihydroneopterin aldolase/epimerase/oxygenase
MTDRIVLAGMLFLARHGVNDREKVEDQRFEVDVELSVDTRAAAAGDDLGKTVDYRGVYEIARRVVEDTTLELIESVADRIAREIVAATDGVTEVVVRVRKPDVELGGPLEYAGVEVRRTAKD